MLAIDVMILQVFGGVGGLGDGQQGDELCYFSTLLFVLTH